MSGSRPGPDRWLDVPPDWADARRGAYQLIDVVQREPWTRGMIDAGLEAAWRGWPDVAFLRVYAGFCAAEISGGDLAVPLQHLVDIATATGEPAFAAITGALSSYTAALAEAADRAGHLSAEESVTGPAARIAAAAAILERRDGSVLHRPLAWVDCALAYRRAGLWELEEEMYAQATLDLGDGWPAGEEHIRSLDRRVVEFNRLEARVQLTAELLESGDLDGAAALARDGVGLPGPDRSAAHDAGAGQAAAVRAVLAAAAGDAPARDVAPPPGWPGYAACAHLARAVRCLRDGDASGAADHAEPAVEGLSQDHLPALHTLALAIAAARPPVAPAVERHVAALTAARREARHQLLEAARMHREHERLLHENRRLDARAHVDQLTGLANRHAYEHRLGMLRAGPDTPVGVLMVDVDWFKQINDTHGHTVGDEVLRRVAAALGGRVRGDDLVARLGGDEFIALFDAADEELAAGPG